MCKYMQIYANICKYVQICENMCRHNIADSVTSISCGLAMTMVGLFSKVCLINPLIMNHDSLYILFMFSVLPVFAESFESRFHFWVILLINDDYDYTLWAMPK